MHPRCPICFEDFDEDNDAPTPFTLSCGHVLCGPCIHRLLTEGGKCPYKDSERVISEEEIKAVSFVYEKENASSALTAAVSRRITVLKAEAHAVNERCAQIATDMKGLNDKIKTQQERIRSQQASIDRLTHDARAMHARTQELRIACDQELTKINELRQLQSQRATTSNETEGPSGAQNPGPSRRQRSTSDIPVQESRPAKRTKY